MAGRKHHFIQQHLTRGFAIDPLRRPAQIWVYRKGASPYISSTENYGAQRDFYGPPEDPEVDRAITTAENDRFAEVIEDLRTVKSGSAINTREAARFYQHLLFRSKNIREIFAIAAGQVLEPMRALQNREAFVQEYLMLFFKERPEKFIPKIEVQAGYQFTPEQRIVIIELLRKNSPIMVPQMMKDLWPKFRIMLEFFITQTPELIAAAHKDALRKHFTDDTGAREEEMRQLQWRVYETEEPIILGDSCAFAELANGRFTPIPDKTAEVTNLILPVSSSRYMIGNKTGAASILSCDSLNLAAIECSHETFCASSHKDRHEERIENIGRQLMPLSTDELSEIGTSCLKDCLNNALEKEFG